MSKEPENLILKLLRDIRATQDDHGHEIKQLRKQIAEWQEASATMSGFAVHANVRHDTVAKELEALKKRVAKLEKVQ